MSFSKESKPQCQNCRFTDKDGEDLTGINEGVKFWFDFREVSDPI